MEYTLANYDEDKKIATFVYNKFIHNAKYLKEDLISEAVMTLYKNRPSFDKEKANYSSFACRCAFNAMLMLLRKENRHKEILSLDTEKIADNLYLIDTVEIKTVSADTLLKTDLVKKVVTDKNKDTKILFNGIIQGCTEQELSEIFSISRSAVNRRKQKLLAQLEQLISDIKKD